MSAFDRHPLRREYEAASLRFPRRVLAHRDMPISPQNRRVRFAVDTEQARARSSAYPIRETRQLRRQVKRLGLSSFIPNAPVGPEEV
jgi:hypothetical protein